MPKNIRRLQEQADKMAQVTQDFLLRRRREEVEPLVAGLDKREAKTVREWTWLRWMIAFGRLKGDDPFTKDLITRKQNDDDTLEDDQ